MTQQTEPKRMRVIFPDDQELIRKRNAALQEEWNIMEDELNDRDLEIQRQEEILRLKRIHG